jgi:hypothetical protein
MKLRYQNSEKSPEYSFPINDILILTKAAYFTTERKDRLTVLDVFRDFAPRQFLYNAEAISLLDSFKLAKKIRRVVDAQLEINKIYDENEFNSLLNTIKPNKRHSDTPSSHLRECYEASTEFTMVVAKWHVRRTSGRCVGMPFVLSTPTLALRFRQNNGPTPSGDYQPSRSLSMAGSGCIVDTLLFQET